MRTTHELVTGDARRLDAMADASVDLVVTSPPYPMIEMWDGVFASMEARIANALQREDGAASFEGMHRELDQVWGQCHRLLRPGGLACINVGDATRTLGGEFRLWPNHARIVTALSRLGFGVLPDILWRKQTNAPNKFLGSGMLPAGAYVTYEHEYVLIFRKGANRQFKSEAEKKNRRRSAFFWEERNVWFSDVWFDLKGERQALAGAEARSRSGAFPFELAYRLINMCSVQGDTVLDPFLGTGTTTAAAMASARNSIGCEIDASLAGPVAASVAGSIALGTARIEDRLSAHRRFVAERQAAGKPLKHWNENYSFPVITAQEAELFFPRPLASRPVGPGSWEVEHEPPVQVTVSPSATTRTTASPEA